MPSASGVLLGIGVFVSVLLLPSPVHAAIDGPCDGSAVIDGETYTGDNDTADNPIVIPDKEGVTAQWEGRTEIPIKNHSGHLGVVIGPGTIEIADWSGENAEEATDASGNQSIDRLREMLPVSVVGLYEVTGAHAGEGGTCTGSVMVLIEGNPITTPVGASAAVGTLLALGGIVLSGRVRAT